MKILCESIPNEQTGCTNSIINAGLKKSLFPQPEPELQEPPQSDLPVKVVLAYDDAALHAARGIYRGVAGRLSDRLEFCDSWWGFGAFAQPESLARAVDAAAEADLVFCCPKNPHFLPREVQNWLGLWLARRKQPEGALVMLQPVAAEQSSHPTLMERDLRETARVSGLAFFTTGYVPLHFHVPQSHGTKTPVALEDNLGSIRVSDRPADMRYWGINE